MLIFGFVENTGGGLCELMVYDFVEQSHWYPVVLSIMESIFWESEFYSAFPNVFFEFFNLLDSLHFLGEFFSCDYSSKIVKVLIIFKIYILLH